MANVLKLPSGSTISWGQISKMQEYQSATPEKQASIKQKFFAASAKQSGSHAFDAHPETEAAAKEHESSILQKIGETGSFQDLTKAGEIFLEADRPVLERVAPGVAAKIRQAAEMGGEFAEEKAGKVGEYLAGDIGKKALGGTAGFLTRAAGNLPVDITSPTSLATFGAEGIGRSAALAAARGGEKAAAMEALAKKIGGERMVSAGASRVAAEDAAQIEAAQQAAEKAEYLKAHPQAPDLSPQGMPTKEAVGPETLKRGAVRYKISPEELERQALGGKAPKSIEKGAKGAEAPRGSLRSGVGESSEVLPKPVEREALVEPASETPMAPGSDMPKNYLSAELESKAKMVQPTAADKKAAEYELRLQESGKKPADGLPYQQTAEDVATERKIKADIAEAVAGKTPKMAEKEKSTSWLGRKAHAMKKYFIDPNADVRLMDEDLHRLVTQGGDKNVGVYSHDTAKAVDALTSNIKDASEKSLFNKLYAFRSLGEYYEKTGKDFGGLGSRAAQFVEENIHGPLVSAGKTDVWNRVNKAVEEFADATRSVGLERAKNVIGEENAAKWAKDYRYYMSLKGYDDEMTSFVHGAEGIKTHSIPSMDEYATGFMKGRVEGSAKAFDVDPLEQFQKSHWNKIVAAHKKEVVDKAVEVSTKRLGESLTKEFELAGGKGWGKYTLSNGKEVPMPDFLIDFLSKSDRNTSSLFSEMANAINPISRRGYLDLNVRYYPGMIMRDVADYFLRAPGYLTPQTEFLAKKLGSAVGVTEKAPNLEYLANPAPLVRGFISSMRANFPGLWKGAKVDKIYEELERSGALQTGTIQHAMKSASLKALYPDTQTGVVKKMANSVWENLGNVMKAWDDTIRIGNYLRNVPEDMRGIKNMGKIINMEELPKGPVSSKEMAEIVRNTHIDFRMMGEGMRSLKFLNPFINPAVQDKFQTWQYAKNQPISFGMTTAAFLSGAATAYMQWKASGDDRKLNPQDTQKFILLNTGIKSKEGGIYAMPVAMIPDSIQPAWIALRNAIDIMHEKDPEFRNILKKQYVSKTASQGVGAMANISGPLVAGVETMINHSFYTGKPIEGKYDENLSPGLRASKRTENLYRAVGEKLGWLGLTPDKAKYLTRGVIGSPASATLARMADPLAKKMVREPAEEGLVKPIWPPSKWGGATAESIKNLPKTMGLVREQRYDKAYEEQQALMADPLTRDADARHLVRTLGQRLGQEKDEAKKQQYINEAIDVIKTYYSTFPEGQKPVDLQEVFEQAAEDAAKSSVLGSSWKTMGPLLRKYPFMAQKVMEREKGQGQ